MSPDTQCTHACITDSGARMWCTLSTGHEGPHVLEARIHLADCPCARCEEHRSHTEMARLLAEIEVALLRTEWQQTAVAPFEHGTRLFEGHTPDGWRLVVADFEIESQGFPPGSRGHDGCAAKGGTVIRFTRELAKRVFEAALTNVRKRDTNVSRGE